MNKKQLILGGVVGLALIAGGAIWLNAQQGSGLPADIAGVNGRLELGRVDVATLYPGRILTIPAKEGQDLALDDVVAELSASETAPQLAAAKAAKQRAEQAVARAEAEGSARFERQRVADIELNEALKLRRDDLISKVELDRRQAAAQGERSGVAAAQAAKGEALAAVQEAQAQINRIQSVNDDMVVRAPIAGRVEYRIVEPGAVVPAGGKIVTLLNSADAYMTLFLPTDTIGQLRLNAPARIVVDGLDYVFPATVSFISAQAQFTPKYVETSSEREKLMYKVKLQIPEDVALKYKDLLKGGLTGNGYVGLSAQPSWPESLTVKLPKE
ncbi:HlyD family secretion protein [Neisseriaceae bacterium CLB008]